MKKLIALLPILIIVAASCRPKGGMDANTGYFSATHFRDSVCIRMPDYDYNKTLIVDGKAETISVKGQKINQVDFVKSFEINKPAYRNSYSVNTTKIVGGVAVTYTLNNGLKYPVKFIKYTKLDNGACTIVGNTLENNLITTIKREIQVDFTATGFSKLDYKVEDKLTGSSPSITEIKLERVG